jgi:thiol-disulfide isomerase/thioredoxin
VSLLFRLCLKGGAFHFFHASFSMSRGSHAGLASCSQRKSESSLALAAVSHIDRALWTITFDSVKFDRPTPPWALDMAEIPTVQERSEWIGKAAPRFKLPASDGSPVALSSVRDKEVLLDFWSITCGPCKLEMPMIEEVGHEYEGRGVVLLGISFDPTEKSKTWLDRNHRTLRTLRD